MFSQYVARCRELLSGAVARISGLLCLLLVAVAGSANAAEETYTRGVVSVPNPHAAEVGARILEGGGNAVDAAVAIAYALNVVEPQSSGLGGGGFMMIRMARTGETVVIDSRETAPAAATSDMFVGVPNTSLQGVAVGVPGMVRGTALALREYGSMPLRAVLRPVISLARDGFAATPRYAAVSCNSRSMNSPESSAFFCPDGAPPAVGAIVRNPALAETLRLIALNGPDCFYIYRPEIGCDIAKGIIEGQSFQRTEAGSKGGSMTYADLAGYQAIVREPLVASYRGYTLMAVPPPSSGGLTALQSLQLVERFPIGDEVQSFGFGRVPTMNVIADALRIAMADRAIWMGDADRVPVPVSGLLNPQYVAGRGASIVAGNRLEPNPAAGDPRPYEVDGLTARVGVDVAAPLQGPGESTTNFAVVDRRGNVVSYSTSIESSHGIGVFAGYRRADGSFRSHGFLLNNTLVDFNLTPSVNPYTGLPGYNDVEPGKRPRSSMAPTMIVSPDRRSVVAFGSSGGTTIIPVIMGMSMNLIDHGMSLQQAIDAPRESVTSANSTLSLESGFAASVVDDLRALGYTVGGSQEIGSVQAVQANLRTGKQVAAADARREGTVIGLPRARAD